MRPHLVLAAFLLIAVDPFPARAAGPITSGATVAGSLSGPAYLESWTFSATINERVVIAAVTTSGAVNTNILLRAPGGAVLTSTTSDRIEFQLTSTGVHTIEVSDVGLNDAGSYALGFVNVTSGPYADVGELDGGAIGSSEVLSGTMSGVADLDAYTFTGTVGDRVLMNAVATAGVGFNTTLYLYPPDGASVQTITGGDRLDFQLNATGTWTLLIEDSALDTPGSYSMSLMNVTAGPFTTGGDTDGGLAVLSNAITSGQFQQGVDFDAYTFTGVAGERWVFVQLATGGGTHNPSIGVYPPGGGASLLTTASDRADVQLTASGTWTLVIEDSGNNDTGSYRIALLNVTSGPYTDGADTDGGPIISSEVRTGTIGGLADLDAFTFTGTVGDRVLMNAVATAGAGFNTSIYLYPPGGASLQSTTGGDRLDVQLNATGTWTIVIEDNAMDTPGSYSMSFMNVTAGPFTTGGDTDGGVAVLSNEITTGQFQQGVDFDAYTFTGVAGQRWIFAQLATGGGTHNPGIAVYPPGGGTSVLTTTSDRADVQLTASGTWTLVIDDSGNNDTGSYTIALLNVTNGPYSDGSDADGGAMLSSEVRTGTITGLADLDAYTFAGTSGDRVLVDAVATAGAGFNTTINLYPPNGAPLQSTTGGDKLDVQLNATGTWTIVIEDNALDTPGSYSMSLLNVTAGPFTTGGDADGGVFIVSSEIKTGQFQQGVDFDAYTFSATAGERWIFVQLATGGGTHNPSIGVYPPGGGASQLTTASDRADVQITTTGTWTLVLDDSGNNDAGAYTVAVLNVTNGPFTTPSDPQGGQATSNVTVSGTMSGPGDLDGYQFHGTSGRRALVGAVATAGVGFNTTLYLYPPGGGSVQASTGGDRLDYQLNATGIWTIVIEDNAVDTPGSYDLTYLNVSAGPFTGGAETDGGDLAQNTPTPGSALSPTDFDGYQFYGYAGQTASISAVTTSGAMNTQVTLYPAEGGVAILSTAADVSAPVLPANGTYTLVVEDAGLEDTGTYTLSLNLTGGATPVPGLPPAALALRPATPSPFSHTTRVGFDLPADLHVRLRVYNVLGQRVRDLVDERRGAGTHVVEWDGRDARGRLVASGVYYLHVEAGGVVKRQKLVLVR